MSKEKKMIIAALSGLVAVIVAIILLIPSCDSETSAAPRETGATIQDSAIGETASEDDITAKSTPDSDADHTPTDSTSNEPGGTAQPSGGNSGSGGAPSSPAQKKWVPDYKDVWIEDSAPWDKQVPIYDYVEISVCNVCGAEITGNEAAHAKAHALAGEGGGHHNDFRSVITGYETIHHDASGHWETVENGGHWE